MTSSAATTPKRPKIFPPQSRLPRSLPCSTRRLAWWSLRARGSTLSRRPNSASTCRIKRPGRSGSGLPPGQTSRGSCVCFLPAVLKDWGCYWFHWSQDSRDLIKELVLSPDGEFPLCHSLLIFIHSLDGHFSGATGEGGKKGVGLVTLGWGRHKILSLEACEP